VQPVGETRGCEQEHISIIAGKALQDFGSARRITIRRFAICNVMTMGERILDTD